ncbi:hypothetical protein B0H17DRAFT_453306 [Mycena rosella]|uniref:Uncharacterized protein n=1 Tax=Mycena rosella TaxID=1033263 RepID=A0AAD7GZ36_MYCRO|nr:hypothetical protein B0H17DRAFT_453306 [Mycena rosella]
MEGRALAPEEMREKEAESADDDEEDLACGRACWAGARRLRPRTLAIAPRTPPENPHTLAATPATLRRRHTMPHLRTSKIGRPAVHTPLDARDSKRKERGTHVGATQKKKINEKMGGSTPALAPTRASPQKEGKPGQWRTGRLANPHHQNGAPCEARMQREPPSPRTRVKRCVTKAR